MLAIFRTALPHLKVSRFLPFVLLIAAYEDEYGVLEELYRRRRLLNKELYALYSSPNIIRVIKAKGLRWAGHVARMGGGEVHTGL